MTHTIALRLGPPTLFWKAKGSPDPPHTCVTTDGSVDQADLVVPFLVLVLPRQHVATVFPERDCDGDWPGSDSLSPLSPLPHAERPEPPRVRQARAPPLPLLVPPEARSGAPGFSSCLRHTPMMAGVCELYAIVHEREREQEDSKPSSSRSLDYHDLTYTIVDCDRDARFRLSGGSGAPVGSLPAAPGPRRCQKLHTLGHTPASPVGPARKTTARSYDCQLDAIFQLSWSSAWQAAYSTPDAHGPGDVRFCSTSLV